MSFSDKYDFHGKTLLKIRIQKRNNKMIVKIVLSTVVIISQLHLLHATDTANKGLDDLNDIGAALKVAAQEKTGVEEGYSSDVEYTRHQAVNNRFFKRLSTKPVVRAAVQQFKTEFQAGNAFTRINLDGLSSRSRVLLFRELTAAAGGEEKTIPFLFNEKNIHISLNPSLRQPGDGIVKEIGKHRKIHALLDIYKTSYQKKIAKKLLKARKKVDGSYHDSIRYPILSDEGENIDLEVLNVLLDFEVARRLQIFSENDEKYKNEAGEYLDYIGDQGKEGEPAGDAKSIQAATLRYEMYEGLEKNIKTSMTRNTQRAHNQGHESWKRNYMNSDRDMLDRVPVGSAIVGALKLSVNADENELSLQDFFHAPNKHSSEYSYGTYSAFEGVPDRSHRSSATKRIIRKFRGGTKAKHSTREQIHHELLEVFGGDSESEGAPYSDTSDDDSDA